MELLLAGLALWSVVHLLKAVAPQFHAVASARLGPGPWRGLASLLLVASLVLIVLGWRATPFEPLYAPPATPRVAAVLMFVALVLFVSAGPPTNLKRFLRHPQLTGVIVWATTHLLVNGDVRSVVLFGGLGAWAAVEIVAINRRDGVWTRPEPVGALATALPFAIAAAAWLLLAWAHPWIAGVAILPRLT